MTFTLNTVKNLFNIVDIMVKTEGQMFIQSS